MNSDDKYWRNSKHFYEYLCMYVWANLMGMLVKIMQWKDWDKDQWKDILLRKIINFDKNQRQLDNESIINFLNQARHPLFQKLHNNAKDFFYDHVIISVLLFQLLIC